MRLSIGLLALAVAVSASPAVYTIKERANVPRTWTKRGPAPGDHVMNMRIALPQPNFEVLEGHLREISDPAHERYTQHLSKEEVEALIAPHPTSLSAVEKWLAEHEVDVASYSPARDWVNVRVPISVAEKMLNTKYYVYSHEDGDQIIRTESYSLPAHLSSHVELVTPTISFARFKAFKSSIHPETIDAQAQAPVPAAKVAPGGVDPSCNATVTLSCLKQLYKINYTPKAAKKNSIGITGYLEQYVNDEDLKLFYQDQLPEAVGSGYEFFSVKGGLNDQNVTLAGIEANLDAQFAYGLSYPTPGTFWSTAGRPPHNPTENTPTNTNEPYQDWIDYVKGQKELPYSISTSYGEDETSVPESYARRACNEFAQFGARGVTLLFSSGDGGVGDGSDDPNDHVCHRPDGSTKFLPTFPAACPYVTAVGGTNNVPEIAVFFSGGGFSDYFPRPWYQEVAIPGYLSKLPKDQYKGLYNPKGRAYPDVAALGRRYRIFWQGTPRLIGGTSASAPTFAAVVALLNDHRIAHGKKPLGFINPALYVLGLTGYGFNDITVGDNPGCGTRGFNSTKGWDPVTGFGTPNFEELVKVLG